MKADLSIVIVNWNSGLFLRRCIESILAAPPLTPFDIYVVDNGSSDDSLTWLRAEMGALAPRLCLIENKENVGFSRANNQAIRLSAAPLILLLNPDTEVTPGAIDGLVAVLNARADIGACGPRLLNTNGSVQPTVWRNPVRLWEYLFTDLRLCRLLPSRIRGDFLLGCHWDHSTNRFVERLSGAALLIRRTAIEEVGALDERFHMYGEDVEWCFRASKRGWRLLFVADVRVFHHGAQCSRARWGDGVGVHRKSLEGYLQFQSLCLPRWYRCVSSLLGLVVSFLIVVIGTCSSRVSRNGKALAEMKRNVYRDDFKRALWGVTGSQGDGEGALEHKEGTR